MDHTPYENNYRSPCHSTHGNGGSGVRGFYGPPSGSNGHYPNLPESGYNGHYNTPGGGDDGPPDDPYGTHSESSSSSEPER